MLDQRSDAVFAESVVESFRVVATISREAPQIAGLAPGDLRADLRSVFLAHGRVDVGELQRFDIHESSDFQRSDAVVDTVGVVAAKLVAVEASRINTSVAGAFLGASAEKRTPRLGRNPLKPSAKHRVVSKSGESDLFEDSGHF